MAKNVGWKKLNGLVFILALLILLSFPTVGVASEKIVISFWQPRTATGVGDNPLMLQIIDWFEAQNPHIRVEYFGKLSHTGDTNFYVDTLGESLRVGDGPDVVTLFNGWIPAWVSEGYIIPLPEDAFPPEWIDEQFFEIVTTSRYQERYWALPTAVRTMALFYNKDIFDRASLPYPQPEWTWQDMARIAEQIDRAGLKTEDGEAIVGFDWEITGWGHHYLREVLVPQFGGVSYVDNSTESIWDSPSACEAFTWLLSLENAPRPTSSEAPGGTNRTPGQYFTSGRSAMHVDGSFRVNATRGVASNLNSDNPKFGVVPLPMGPKQNADGFLLPRTFGSYWTHGLTPRVLEDKQRYEASITFLNFITSPEIGQFWMESTGELAAQQDAITEELRNDEWRGPFLKSLDFAYATPFADETLQLTSLIAAYDAVLTDNTDPCDALNATDMEIQEILDDFVENQNRWERQSATS